MAVTHADLALSRRITDLNSKTGAFIIVLTILIGLFCFILCLLAETTRSEVTWVSTTSNSKENNGKYECFYGASGKAPLLCSACAFVVLAFAMVLVHSYILIAVSETPSADQVNWDTASLRFLTYQAALFFLTTWICFAVGEILLLIGLGVESGHLRKWWEPRPSCLMIREGLFSAAGVLALTTVFLAAGLYLTALRAQRIYKELENERREVLETSTFYASPPISPQQNMTPVDRENPMIRHDQYHRLLLEFPTPFKTSNAP